MYEGVCYEPCSCFAEWEGIDSVVCVRSAKG